MDVNDDDAVTISSFSKRMTEHSMGSYFLFISIVFSEEELTEDELAQVQKNGVLS